jgi:SNF2 family DNA or RNA helicase
LIELPADDDSITMENTIEGSSPKIDALLKQLVNSKAIKSVVFSQWTSMLDKVQMQLKKQRIKYTRFDGAMSIKQREENLGSIIKPSYFRF